MLPRWTALTAAVTCVSAFAVPRRLQPDTAASSRRDEAMARLEREDAGICTMYLSRVRAIGLAPIRFLIILRESPFIFQHFVLGIFEPLSGRWTKRPEHQASKCDRGYDSDNDVDHWPCASLRSPSYRLRTYRASRVRSSSLSRLFHAGIELPEIPRSITDRALSAVG